MMDYTERLRNVAVLGAAGKMGSGILLLTAVEMADQMLDPANAGKTFTLHAIDVSPTGLQGLVKYVRGQVLKVAEKKTVALRKVYADRKDLIENSDIIEAYIEDVLSIICPSTRLESAYDATLVFEAVSENPALKVKIFKQIEANNQHKPWYFTNTSSVPIKLLEKDADLQGRVVGFHFYNPPAVQKLVELIVTPNTLPEAKQFALDYAKRLRKIIVPSNDFAGFIGNGHFMRDALYAIKEAEKLSADMPLTEAIYTVNKVAQDYLVRPMGIFQLIDYVGVDVCKYIMGVMNPYLADENLHSELLDRMDAMGVKGGQYSDGSQKDGFLKYEKGRVTAVFDPEKKEYVSVAEIAGNADSFLGESFDAMLPWRTAIRAANKDELLQNHFSAMKQHSSKGAELAHAYHMNSKAIGNKLVADKVAFKPDDVNTVMLTGFFHAYGPINDLLG